MIENNTKGSKKSLSQQDRRPQKINEFAFSDDSQDPEEVSSSSSSEENNENQLLNDVS